MAIPRYFCWTRFGTEAAQTIEQILARKEEERTSGDGIFLWGIGNAVGRAITELVRVTERPQILFSAIKSVPRLADVQPPAVVAWTFAQGLDGAPYPLPERALVTSRYDPSAPRTAHYALVCRSTRPLEISSRWETIKIGAVRNLTSGRPIGSSQVTAVVVYDSEVVTESTEYEVAFEADLVRPYFIRLRAPVPLRALDDLSPRRFDFESARAEVYKRTMSSTPHQLCFPLSPRSHRELWEE